MTSSSSSTSTPMTVLTVLIAAHDLSQRLALAQLVASLRGGARTIEFGGPGPDAPEAAEADLALVVEPGPELGQLAKRVRAGRPGVGLIIIAPRFDDATVELAGSVDAAAIVTSPVEPGGLVRLFADWDRKLQFAGRCARVETSELIRLHAAAASTGVLYLASAAGSGAMHFDEGQLIHAHTSNQRGVEAVHELLGWADASTRWIVGRSASARTIHGRVEALLDREGSDQSGRAEVEDAPQDVLEKLDRLAQTPDILAAYLLRDSKVITGRNDSALDDAVVGRALSRLSMVFRDMEEQQGDAAGTEVQATIGEHRLVVDRLGPSRLGFQIGVVVRQATPVCKSLRRLLRQIDRSFRKSLSTGTRASAGSPGSGGDGRPGLRVA